MTITLTPEVESQLLTSIRRFSASHFDEEIGDLKARLLLDFCLREVGPSVYNQAVRDAQQSMHEKIDEVDVHCYQQEFNYWKK